MKQQVGRIRFGRGYYIDFDQMAHLLKVVKEGVKRSLLVEKLGVSKAKTDALLSLARGFDLLQRSRTLRLTPLGNLITQHDPFFVDTGTLWFLHYVVSSEIRQLIWNQFVTHIFPQVHPLTLQQFRQCLADEQQNSISASTKMHIYQETRLVFDTYIHKNFAKLGYFCTAEGTLCDLGHCQALPTLVLAASIAHYRDRYHAGDTAVLVADLIEAPNGPGVVFQLSEEHLRAALEELKLYPGVLLESRADLDQVRLTDTMPDYVWMECYYASR